MKYFERVFQEFLPQIKEQIYVTYVLKNSQFWAKLPLIACGSFLLSKSKCIFDF